MSQAVTYIEIDVPTFVPQSPEMIETYRFAMPTDYLDPAIDAIASIDGVEVSPARISLGKDLGQRASIEVKFRDHRHIFNGEPYNQGTFWGKWRGRHGTKLRGRAFRLIRGFVGQALEDMDTRHYVIERTDGPTLEGVYTIEAKDILKLADDDRAQAPALSNGSLAGAIDSAVTSLTLSPTGIGDLEYPASGWVCVGGKEVVSFTRSGDVLTIARGEFGTVAQTHDAGDRVQLVLRYTGDDPADIIHDLLTNYAGVSGSYIDLSTWQEETANFLNVIYARTITEPTSVNKLVSELIEQAALALWWDDRAKKVRLQVLREISTDADTFDQERIIEGSLSVKEQPERRISQIWTYYGQRDPTDSGGEEDNYRAALATVDLVREAEYGSAEIRKIQAQWVETENAATRLNGIQISRFRDPPRNFAFQLFRDEIVALAGGYQLAWWGNQDETGAELPARIQITRIRFLSDRIEIEAEEMLAFDTIVLVNVVFLTTTGSLQQWTVPASWNNADNFVACIAGGAGGYRPPGSNGGKGGGGGAFSMSTNLTLTPSSMVDYQVGDRGLGGTSLSTTGKDGGNTWFNGATFGVASVAAEGGNGGTGRTTGGQGGQAANGAGDTKFSGGDGGDGASQGETRAGGGGGGGAAGPHGDGGDGGNGLNGDTGAGGGAADGGEDGQDCPDVNTEGVGGNNRFNFGGGTQGSPVGQQGGGGKGGARIGGVESGFAGGDGEQLWTQTVAPITSAGPGGGGGGGASGAAQGGDGGRFGGGGGGGGEHAVKGGDGQPGIIVVGWREAA